MGLRTRASRRRGSTLGESRAVLRLSGGDGWSRGGVQVCVASTSLCVCEAKSEIRAFDWTDKADLANASPLSDGEKRLPDSTKNEPITHMRDPAGAA